MMAGGDTIHVAGAGPAGLAAAITLARAGRRVLVHEALREVGCRFQRDLQGIENWTSGQDALQVLRDLQITTAFASLPCCAGTAFDGRGNAYHVQSEAPVFYLVERGPRPGSFDRALLEEALALGVRVQFNSRVTRLDAPGVLATGPKAADAVAAGYHFDTEGPSGFWVILDGRLAPGGYAYLLVMDGRGTVKTCMFSGFKEQAQYVHRTVEAFRRLVGLRMRNPIFHAGVGNLCIPASASSGPHPIAGEQAGFQDMLGGFGIRLAVSSGVLAARCLLAGEDYEEQWRRDLAPWLRATLVTRACYGLLNNAGYRLLLSGLARCDARRFLNVLYRPSGLKHFLLPWALRRYHSRRQGGPGQRLASKSP